MNQAHSTLTDPIITNCQRMSDLLTPLSNAQFFAPQNGKWSAAETLQHLHLSARNLPRMLIGPRTFFDQWPRSERMSRPYDAIAANYNRVLSTNAFGAPASLVARPDDIRTSKTDSLHRFTSTHQALVESIAGWSMAELDAYQIPHPALGLITIGEMMTFTAYHIEHHRTIEEELLS